MRQAYILDTTMLLQNPFNSNDAKQFSNYNGFDGSTLVNISTIVCPKTQEVHNTFRHFILSEGFSCILGKAAIKRNAYRFGFYANMNSDGCLQGVAHDLYNFVMERPTFGDKFSTFVACFHQPQVENEKHFETTMWKFLYRLQQLDQQYHTYDSAVSSNPEDNNYAYSFGRCAFFIVGLHPQSSRSTRKFAYPTIVFNPHVQFRNLKATQKFSKYQRIIRQRELELQGSINPNLAEFGETSEAKQYSGRHVEQNWVCPFHAKKIEKP